MTKKTPRKNFRTLLVMAIILAFSAFSNAGVLFAAAPTVTSEAATFVNKTSAQFNLTINSDGGEPLSVAGVEYGTTVSYGSTATSEPYSFADDIIGPGSSDGELSLPGDLAIDSTGNIFVADTGNNRIQKFNSAGVYQSQFGVFGTGNGEFNGPTGIDIDSSNNIFVVDSGNNRIQKFNSAGVYQSQFGSGGNGNGQFNTATKLHIDSANNIFVVDSNNSRIQKFNSAGVYQSQFGSGGNGNGQFNFANSGDVTTDSLGNIFVVDTLNFRIQKFNSAGVYQSQFGVFGTGNGEFDQPSAIEIDQDDVVYVSDTNGGRVQKLDTAGNFISSNVEKTNIGGSSVYGLAINNSKEIYISIRDGSTVYKIDQTNIANYLNSLTCGTDYHYRAFATNADGTSYGNDVTFTTTACDLPVVVTKATTEIRSTAVILNGLQTSDGVGASTVRGFQYGTTTGYGSSVNTSPGTSLSVTTSGSLGTDENSFDALSGVGQDASGNIYVADTGNNRIVELDSSGTFITMFGWGVATGGNSFESCSSGCQAGISGSGSGQFNAPQDVAVDMGTGNIYVSDTGNNRIQVFNSSHVYQSQFGSFGTGAGQFSSPKGIAIYSSSIYLADSGNNRIQKLNTSGTMLAQSTGLSSPSGVVISDDGYVYVTDTGNDRIWYLNTTFSSSGDVSFVVPSGWTAMDSPVGIAIDTDFGIYITDSVNDRVIYASREADPDEYTFVSSYGSNGSSIGQFDTPKDILLNVDTFKLYSADSVNSRLQIFRPFFYKELKPLTCGTTYHYRAFATNSDGTAYGDDVAFTTLACGSLGGGGGPTDPPAGCTDPAAQNYDAVFVVDDGSCTYPVYGCPYPTATNYNPSATDDDGSCVYPPGPVPGCTDPTADNYNASATVDDGSCDYDDGPETPGEEPGCTDTFATNYDASADVDDGSCEYTLTSIAGCTDSTALNYNSAANVGDGSCTYENPPDPETIPEIIKEVIKDISGYVSGISKNTAVVPVVQAVAVTGLTLPLVLYILAERAGIVSIALRLWNIIPTLLGFRRKRRPWGTVYDSVTKQPLDPVYVTLLDMSGREVATSITDLDGRYGFVTERGQYRLDAKKGDYIFPSVKLRGADHDDLYGNLYFGEEIGVETEGTIINKNIPMDSINFNWNEFEKTKNKGLMKFFSKGELFLARIGKTIFIAGFAASAVLIFLEPSTLNYVILSIYVLITVLAMFGVRPKRPGFAIERDTGYPLSFAIVSVYSALLDKEIAHTIVGKTGKYHVLVPKGNYYLKVKKKTGEDSYEEVYTSEEFKAKKGYINKILRV